MRWSLLTALLVVCAISADTAPGHWAPPCDKCPGARAGYQRSLRPQAATLLYQLPAGAFPDSGRPDVAVHVPPGFDPTRKPGVVVYFHGWNGCASTALGDEDSPCSDGGDPRPAASLGAQVDAAKVNALMVAVELRADMPTGEAGQFAKPGGLRNLLGELFAAMAEGIGTKLEVDAVERVVVIAHSGGYQAAAGAVEFGDVPQISEVDLLDALYGANDLFFSWIRDSVALFDPRVMGPRRFIDLYTCCAGALAASRSMARDAANEVAAAAWGQAFYDDDSAGDLDAAVLAHPIVFKRVPRSHGELPFAYVRLLVESAGFATLR